MITPTRTAKEQFDRQAAQYNSRWSGWSESTLQWILDNAELQSSDNALDIATGTGFVAVAVAPHVASVIGLDVSTGMLAQARLRAAEQDIVNATFQEGAAESLPFANGTFDLVTSRIAPHHFLSVIAFLAEAHRVLKPNGRFLLVDTSVPDNDIEADAWQNKVEIARDPSHIRNYSPSEWQRNVEAAGLTIEQVSDAEGGIPITLEAWLETAGCTSEAAENVRALFANAPPSAVRTYQIEARPDGDTGFIWRRILLKARKL